MQGFVTFVQSSAPACDCPWLISPRCAWGFTLGVSYSGCRRPTVILSAARQWISSPILVQYFVHVHTSLASTAQSTALNFLVIPRGTKPCGIIHSMASLVFHSADLVVVGRAMRNDMRSPGAAN